MRKWIVLLSTALVCAVAGCSPPSPEPASLGTVSGAVLQPVEGAILDVYRPGEDLRGPPMTQLGPLGADGRFRIDLPPGEYRLVARRRVSGEETGPVRHGDVKTDPLTIRVEAGRPLQADLLAYVKQGNEKEAFGAAESWKAGVAGVVLDAEGRPVEGLRVHVYDHVQMSERPKFVSAKTGPDGRYEVPLPEGGTYYLCARDKYGGPPKVGDLYGRYDRGTIDPSAVIVPEGGRLAGVDITVHTVW